VNQVQEMAEKYILPQHSYILVVGDKEKLMEELKEYSADGKILLVDDYGNPVEEATEMDADLTAEKVYDRYFEAIGGKEKLENIRDMKQEATTSMSGMTLNIVTYKKAPNKFKMEMLMNGNVMSKQVFDGEKGSISGPQGSQELQGDQLKQMKYQATMNQELKYDELGVETSLKGIEKVNGKDAYKVEVNTPNGNKSFDYFDTETGLKLQTKTTVQTPQGEFTQVQTFADYKEVDGIKFPFIISTSGMQNLTMDIQSIEINKGIEDSVFE